MKYYFSMILLINAFSFAYAQPDFLWANQAGGAGNEVSFSIETDGSGNSFVSGYYEGTASFGTYDLVSAGSFDVFITRLDTDGNFLWAVSAGGTGAEFIYGGALDTSGNYYLTGFFMGTANFGPTMLVSTGYQDFFIAKIDTDGNFLWAKRAGGAENTMGYDVTVASSGNIYCTGQFYGTAYFGSTELIAGASSQALFVTALDADGNFLWARSAGGDDSYTYGLGIITDSSENVYITGTYFGSVSFGPYNISSAIGDYDIFAAALDANGSWLWAQSAGGNYPDEGRGIDIGPDGNIIISGYFFDSASFGSIDIVSYGGSDIFFAKIDPDGNFLWAVSAGGTVSDIAYSIKIDSAGNIYGTGRFEGTASFGSSSTELISAGSLDAFIAMADPDGNFIWAERAGGTEYDIGQGISLDDYGRVYVSGFFSGTAYFDSIEIVGGGYDDVFIAKLEGGPDASILPADITYSPGLPQPGDTVTINARVYNLGDTELDSGNAGFYWSIEPDVDLQLIGTVPFGPLLPGDYEDVAVDWVTAPDMDPMSYIITVVLSDVLAWESRKDNNTASMELPLPVDLGYFSATGIGNRANIAWMTVSETDNLGFNIYRMRGDKINQFIAFFPVRLNSDLIPGQGTSSEPKTYCFTDYVKNHANYIYILESVSTGGETQEFKTRLEWLN